MDQQTQTEVEAAAFRRLLAHLDSRKDVQNIELFESLVPGGGRRAGRRHGQNDRPRSGLQNALRGMENSLPDGAIINASVKTPEEHSGRFYGKAFRVKTTA